MKTTINVLDINMDLRTLHHELRTPLTAIIGISHLLASEALSERQKTEYLNYLTHSSDRLKRFIEQLLASPIKNINVENYNFLSFKTKAIHHEVALLLMENTAEYNYKTDEKCASLP